MIGASAVACTKERSECSPQPARPGISKQPVQDWEASHVKTSEAWKRGGIRALLSPAAEITTPCISDGEVVFAFICFPLGWVVSASMLSFSLAGNPKPVGGRPRNRTEPSDPQSIAPKLCPAASYYE